MPRIVFTVKTTAKRWWVAVEDGDREFKSPRKSATFVLPEGEKHAVVYFAQGAPGDTFQVSGADSAGKVIVATPERSVSASGFAFGHKVFVP